MKILGYLFFFIIAVLGLGVGCRAKHNNIVIPRWQLELSQSGGFTGGKTIYHLEEGGHCYRLQTVSNKTDTVKAIRHLEPALVQSILRDLNSIQFKQIQLQATGNVTLSVVFTEAGKNPHLVSWSAGAENVPKPLKAFYDKTLKQLRPYFNTVK